MTSPRVITPLLALGVLVGCSFDDRFIRPYMGGADASATTQRSCEGGASGCGMVSVPGGTFAMGDPMARRGGPVQTAITVSPFMIDRYEVTVARFRRFWDAGHPGVPDQWVVYRGGRNLPWALTTYEPGRAADIAECTWNPAAGNFESRPINCVDWFTAQAFCVWDGGRLPTEAEWEFAARGTDGRAFPWGNEAPDGRLCWGGNDQGLMGTCDEEGGAFTPGASPFGAIHMSGNVWEWTADSYGDYGNSDCWMGAAQTDPICSANSDSDRVVRGGAWHYTDAVDLRAAARGGVSPTSRNVFGIGFRCAR